MASIAVTRTPTRKRPLALDAPADSHYASLVMTEIDYRPPHAPLVPPGGSDLHARDMTATFSADLTLGEAQRRLAEIGQWLPVDGDPDATLGHLIDRNSTGPLRLGFGAWRDLLLGAQFTTGSGELITAGGRTVKNVAGYDLTKFMVGQHGTFGRLVTLTTRTYRQPAAAVLARYAPDSDALSKLLPTPLRPQWAVLTPESLFCGYLGDVETTEWYATNAAPTSPLEVVRRGRDEDITHRQHLWRHASVDATFRASIPPARLREFVTQLTGGDWSADAAFGIVIGPVADPALRDALRRAATSAGGSVTFAGIAGAAALEFSTTPVQRRIIERLKAAFDPEGRLEPLPW